MTTEAFDLSSSAASVEHVVRICARKGHIIIVLQDNPDPDALASAAVLREIILARLNKRAAIGYGGALGRSENKTMVRLLHIPARHITPVELDLFSILCLVDTQPHFGNHPVTNGHPTAIVIDHHLTHHNDSVDAQFADIRPTYGATSTILYEYAQAAKLRLTATLATGLLYGIQSDTQDLGRETSAADLAAYTALFALADKTKLSRIRRAPLPVEYFRAVQDSLTNCVVAGTTVVCSLHDGGNPDMIAEIVDRMVRLEGIRVAVCYGVCGGVIHISARTVDARSNAARKMRQVVSRLGSGGGHNTVAGGQVPIEGDPQKRLALVHARILKAFAGNKPAKPLLTTRQSPSSVS